MATWSVGAGQTYATPQAAVDAMIIALGDTPFTEEEIIEIHAGTYDSVGVFSSVMLFAPLPPGVVTQLQPTIEFPLTIRNYGSDVVNFNLVDSGGIGMGAGIASTQFVGAPTSLSNVHIEGINFLNDGTAISHIAIYPWVDGALYGGVTPLRSSNWRATDCTFDEDVNWWILDGCHNVTLINCIATGYHSLGCIGNIVAKDPLNPLYGNMTGTFYSENCIYYGETGPVMAGDNLSGMLNVILKHNVIWGWARSLKLAPNDNDSTYTVNLILENNIFYGAGGAGAIGGLDYRKDPLSALTSFDLINVVHSDGNIFYGGGWVYYINPDDGNRCVTLSDWQDKFHCDAHSLDSNPLFVNGSAKELTDADFSLQSSSPALKAGLAPTIEGLGGNLRSATIDIGPYQQSPSSGGTSSINSGGLMIIHDGELQ